MLLLWCVMNGSIKHHSRGTGNVQHQVSKVYSSQDVVNDRAMYICVSILSPIPMLVNAFYTFIFL